VKRAEKEVMHQALLKGNPRLFVGREVRELGGGNKLRMVEEWDPQEHQFRLIIT
jgi:hypothetical protein